MTHAISSEQQLQAIRAENERIQHRIDELQKIVSDETTSIVQRSKAKVELSQLHKVEYHHSTRASVAALTKGSNYGHVSKNKAKLEREVKRNEERLQHEEEILQIQQELQCELAIISMEVRQTLEKRLSLAKEAIEALDVEEAEEMVQEMYGSASQGHTSGVTARTFSVDSSIHSILEDLPTAKSIAESDLEEDCDEGLPKFAEDPDPGDPELPTSTSRFDSTRISDKQWQPKSKGDADSNTLAEDEHESGDAELPGPSLLDDYDGYSPESIAVLLDSEEDGGSTRDVAPGDSELPMEQLLMTCQMYGEAGSRELLAARESFYPGDEEANSSEHEGPAELSKNEQTIMNQASNEDRIKVLERQVTKLLAEASEREAVLTDWKFKATKLASACVALAGDVKERDKSIQELEDSNRVKEERILSLKSQKLMNNNPASTFLDQSIDGSIRGSHSISNSRRSRRRFSVRASIDTSFSATLKRASMVGEMNEQIREEAKIEMMALEERLKMMDSEKADLLHELKTVKAILAETSDQKQGKKVERLVYQLSCKKCHKHMNFIGTTHTDLKTTMEKHFDHVVKAAKGGGKKSKSKGSKIGDEEFTIPKNKQQGHEDWSAEFAEHFAKHCKPTLKFKSVSEKDIKKFCRENVKVEVLKRSDGSELYWEDHE